MAETTVTATPAEGQERTRLPGKAIFGLFLAGFIGILTECLPAGLLPEISATLHTAPALTGQIVTVYALATAVAAIPVSHLIRNWPRKNVIQLALGIVAVTNALTALSGNFTLTVIIRIVVGVGTAMVWPHLGGYAARISPAGRQGRAIALALAGTPISLAIGIPAGTFLATFGGWQTAFWVSAALALLNMLWNQFTVPNLPGRAEHERFTIRQTPAIPGLKTILFALTAYMVAHNILYTYVTQFLGAVGMSGQTGWVLLAFGVTSVLSVLVVGAHIDHHLRKLTVASTVLFAISVLVLAIFTGLPVLVYVAAAAWGLAFGSSPSLFIGAAIDATKAAADVAQSITITFFSASIALGGLIGGLVVADLGTTSITWATLALVVIAAITVVAGRRHAFPSTD